MADRSRLPDGRGTPRLGFGDALTSRCYGGADELLPRYAWYAANAAEEYMPVATLLPNAFGLFDVHGNAGEWCLDQMDLYSNRLKARREATSFLASAVTTSPTGPSQALCSAALLATQPGVYPEIVLSSSFRCVRGSPVYSFPRMIRSAKRFGDRPTHVNAPGFRLARSRP